MLKPSVVSIGAGNVAAHLIPALHEKKYPVPCVYSRTLKHAAELATKTGSQYTDKYSEIPLSADIYLITLTDHAIGDVLKTLNGINGIAIHTSASTEMIIFSGKIKRFGVLYPLQTFSKARKISLDDVPFLVEASDENTLKEISNIAGDISSDIRQMSSEQRQWLHLAAIFSCNFINHMLTCASDIMKEKQMDMNLLTPLIRETINKALENGPAKSQTGPAVRGNMGIINKHTSILKDHPDLQKMYTFVSQCIYQYHKTLK